MFTKIQIDYMKKIGLDLDFNNLSEDDKAEIRYVVGDELTLREVDEDYEPTPNGIICESILDSPMLQ